MAKTNISDLIYFHSPIWAQQLYVALYGWWWYQRRFGRLFHKFVPELKEREGWTREQFYQYQEDRLNAVLRVAWRSRYYRQVFAEAGITQGMPPFEALRQLPFLSKETLRTCSRDLLTERPLPKGTLILKSSGTTGTPTDFFFTKEMHQMSMAWFEARARNWANLKVKDRRIMFGVRKVCRFDQTEPPFWRISPMENMAYMSIYHLSPSFMPVYLDFFHKYRPRLVMGYPSALYTLARFALQQGKLPPAAKAVITTSETVTPTIREAIESAWQCQLYDTYGAVEACFFASECEHGRLHLSPDIGIYEILDAEGNPCPPGVIGEAVCTGLHNLLHPLIRYRIGDAAKWSTEVVCPCGRQMPILQSVEGRIEDMCYTKDGRAILRFDTVFKGIDAIREAQVIQEELGKFLINVVPDPNFSKCDIEKIKANMRLHVGDAIVDIREISHISRTVGNKFRPVISKLSPDEIKAVWNKTAS
jgi:phenylacetate-CoA ligase